VRLLRACLKVFDASTQIQIGAPSHATPEPLSPPPPRSESPMNSEQGALLDYTMTRARLDLDLEALGLDEIPAH